jgi:hypothetical protein
MHHLFHHDEYGLVRLVWSDCCLDRSKACAGDYSYGVVVEHPPKCCFFVSVCWPLLSIPIDGSKVTISSELKLEIKSLQ